MAIKIGVLAKQVLDPEMPLAAFRIDNDGKNNGFDLQLINAVCEAVTLPVIASSGAGAPAHFSEVFSTSRAEAGVL